MIAGRFRLATRGCDEPEDMIVKLRSATPKTLSALLLTALAFVRPAAAETVDVLWTSFPPAGGTTIELQAGDTIEWDIQVGHDLNEMASQALFDACDFTGSTLISTGPAITQTTFNTPGVHHFACSVDTGFHCNFLNMKVTVVVSEGQPVPLGWPPTLAAVLAVAAVAALRRRR
jgi:plastocyanin